MGAVVVSFLFSAFILSFLLAWVGWASVIGLEVYAAATSEAWKIDRGSMGLSMLLLSPSLVWEDTLIF